MLSIHKIVDLIKTLKAKFLDPDPSLSLYVRVVNFLYLRREEKEQFLFFSDLQKQENFTKFFAVSIKELNIVSVSGLEIDINPKINNSKTELS